MSMDAARRLLLLGVCTAATLFAVAGIASADTLCVGNPGGTCDASFVGPTALQDALTAAGQPAHSADDTIRIAAGTFSGPAVYNNNTNGHVSIVGGGTGQTTLNISPAPSVSQTVIDLAASGESISSLTISVVADAGGTGAHGQTGLHLNAGTATDIAVTSPTSQNVVGVSMSGGTLQQSEITFVNGVSTGNTGVQASAAADIHDVNIVAEGAVIHSGGTGSVSRATITSTFEGVEETAGTLNIDDSLITAVTTSGKSGRGIAADNRNNSSADTDMTVNGRHLTIVTSGTNTDGAFAVAVGNAGMPDTMGLADATVNLADSVITGNGHALDADADNHRTSTINTTYSNYDPATNRSFSHGGVGFPIFNASNQTNLSPGFANPGSDFHLAPGSPLIDIGDPAGGGPATDRDGNSRVVDGHNVCPLNSRRDIGAYELNPGPPPDCTNPDTRIDKAPKKKTHSRKAKFRFSSDRPGSTFLCSLDRRAFVPCTSPAKFKVKTGKHTFRVEAISPSGVADGTPAVKKFRVLPD